MNESPNFLSHSLPPSAFIVSVEMPRSRTYFRTSGEDKSLISFISGFLYSLWLNFLLAFIHSSRRSVICTFSPQWKQCPKPLSRLTCSEGSLECPRLSRHSGHVLLTLPLRALPDLYSRSERCMGLKSPVAIIILRFHVCGYTPFPVRRVQRRALSVNPCLPLSSGGSN